METVIKNILIVSMLLVSAGQAFAYPPDNAAVLYYRSFLLLEEPNDSMKKMLRELKDGNTPLNEQIRQYVERNRKALNEIEKAAGIRNCDWGYDLTEGLSLVLPEIAKCRQMAYILTADVKILAEKGDYNKAIEKCLAFHEMARHIGNDTMIQRLVGIAIGGIANESIMNILPQISDDTAALERLRARLADAFSRSPSMRTALAKEAEVCENNITRDGILAIIEGEPCDLPKEILQRDDEFYVKAREYWRSVMARMQSAFDLPYSQAVEEFEKIFNSVKKDMEEKPEVIVTKMLLPAISRICSYDTRWKTHTNAVLAGIDIYIVRAKTGKLPDKLPAGLPKDMFSNKDFLYEKTDTGFVLKCQGKDLDDIVRQYEFKIAN
jgi:hypothetical protein